MHPAARGGKQHGGRRHRGDEEHPRHRRGVAHVEVRERLLVQPHAVEEQRPLRVARRAAGRGGRDEGLVEVLEAVDHPDHQREEDHRRDHGQGHVAEALPRVCALDRDRLVQVAGDVEQAGEVDHDGVADAPQAEHDQGRLGPGRVVEPERRVDAGDLREQLVHRARGRVQQIHEHERASHRWRKRRHEEERAVDVHAPLGPGQQHGRQHGEDDPQRHRHQDDPHRVAHRPPEVRVGLVLPVDRADAEHEPVVVEADPARRGQQVVVGERVVQAEQHRPRGEEREADDPRREEEQDGGVLAHRRRPSRTPALGRRADGDGARRGECRHAGYGVSPCWIWLSMFVSSCCRPACRFGTLPACHFESKSSASWAYPAPDGRSGGYIDEWGLFQMLTNVGNCGPRFRAGELPEAVVVGTFPSEFASVTR